MNAQRAPVPFGQAAPDAMGDRVAERVVQARLPDRTSRADLPGLDYALSHAITHGIWGGLTERDRRPLRVHHTAATRRDRDLAIAAAAAAGNSMAAIGRTFGLTATSVSRVLSRNAERRRRS